MNLQSIIDNSRMRDNAVAELCKAIDELDDAGLVRVLAHIEERVTKWPLTSPHFGDRAQLEVEAERHKAHVQKTIARAEKGVRTRKRNATKAKTPKLSKKSTKLNIVIDFVTANPGRSPTELGAALNMSDKNVSNYLTPAKKAHLLYNEKGKWYPSQRQIQGHPRAKNALKKLNGAAETKAP